MSTNQQAPEPFDSCDDRIVIHSVWETIQGEGPFSGTPATFVRLAGCNLQCPLCDTNYTKSRYVMEPAEAAKTILERPDLKRLIVITGGEPFRQAGLTGFLSSLWLDSADNIIQIETNGTTAPSWNRAGMVHPLDLMDAHVVCSPKTAKIADYSFDTYKYVLHADFIAPEDGLPTSALGMNQRPARPPEAFKGDVFVSPVDVNDPDENERHRDATLKVCMEYGYRLSLQLHKELGLP